MKRLRDEIDSADANQTFAAMLLSKVPPLEPSTIRQQRVRVALRSSTAKRVALRLSPAFVVAVVVLGATGASAMVARYIVRAHLLAPSIAPSTDAVETEARARTGGKAHPKPLPVTTTIDSIPEPEAPITLQAPAPPKADPNPAAKPSSKSRAVPPVATPLVATPPAGAAAASSPGAALMIEAMQARRSGEMARAAQLLSEYRSKYPDGPLYEEALALSIEAASARGDDARRLASQYLQRYPNGRFREQAERALQSTAR